MIEQSEVPVPEEIPAPPFQQYEPRVRVVLAVQIALFILGAGLGALVFQILCLAMGWDASLSLTADALPMERWQVRLQLGLGHLFAFCVSGGLTVWLFYRSVTGIRPDWPDYLRTRKLPNLKTAGLGVLLMAVSIPFVLFTLNLNKLLPLPELFKMMEVQTEQVIKGLLQMDHFGEFLANLTIIAILPAIGEELVFRGVIQQQLMRRIRHPWLAIVVAAFIFSVAHFQFEGLLPRMVLGILLGWLYWKTQNFWVPVIAHFFNNGIQVFGQYLYGNQLSTVDLEEDIAIPWQFALMSVFMVVVVIRMIQQSSPNTEALAENRQDST